MLYYFFDYCVGFVYGLQNNLAPNTLPSYFPVITFFLSEFFYIFLHKVYKKFLWILPGAFFIIILPSFIQLYINPFIVRMKTYGVEYGIFFILCLLQFF